MAAALFSQSPGEGDYSVLNFPFLRNTNEYGQLEVYEITRAEVLDLVRTMSPEGQHTLYQLGQKPRIQVGVLSANEGITVGGYNKRRIKALEELRMRIRERILERMREKMKPHRSDQR